MKLTQFFLFILLSGSFFVRASDTNELQAMIDSSKYFVSIGREHKSLSVARKAALLAENKQDHLMLSRIYLQMAEAYLSLREMGDAFNYYQKGIKEAQKINDKLQESEVRLALAFYYNENRIFEKSWNEIYRAESIAKQLKDPKLTMKVISQKGVYFRRKDSLPKAIYYNTIAYEMCSKIGTPEEQYDYAINISTALAYDKQLDKAIQYVKIADAINEKQIKSDLNEINTKAAIAWLEALKGNLDQAVTMIQEALKRAQKINNKHILKLTYRTTARIYYRKKDYERAYFYYAEFVKLLESSIEQQRKEDIAQLINSYEVQIREAKIQELKTKKIQQKKLLESKLKNSRNVIIFMGILILFTVIGVILYLRNYRIRTYHKNALTVQQMEIKQHVSYLTAQEEERSRIALELHDSLGSLLSSTKLQLEGFLMSNNDSVLEKVLNNLSNACAEVRTISHNLNNLPLSMGDFESRLSTYLKSIELPYLTVKTDYFVKEKIHLEHATMHQILRIIQELTTNVIKHAEATELLVGCISTDDELLIHVEDNGKGFDVEKARSSGSGLRNVEMRLKMIRGSIELFSIPGASTQVSIRIPINDDENSIGG